MLALVVLPLLVDASPLSTLARRQEEATSEEPTGLTPTHTQAVTLGVAAAYVVVIAVLWVTPVVKHVLLPAKLLVICFHELSHALVGLLTGARIVSITVNTDEGGCTEMKGGAQWLALPAGYLGSSLFGALLTFAGFDTNASKVASIVLGALALVTLLWARKSWVVWGVTALFVGILVACWFIVHAEPLRFVVLFIGVMSGLYSAWDIADDLILRKVNESDASVFAKRYGGSAQCWGVIWCLISLALLVCGILAGLAAFKDSFAEQAADSQNFLPTR